MTNYIPFLNFLRRCIILLKVHLALTQRPRVFRVFTGHVIVNHITDTRYVLVIPVTKSKELKVPALSFEVQAVDKLPRSLL